VDPLVKVAEFVVGEPPNSVVLPPATDAIVATAGPYVIVTEYAPSGMVPASISSSARNCCPGWVVAGQERLASPVAAYAPRAATISAKIAAASRRPPVGTRASTI
jgi:hypothetical protein